VVSLSQEQKYRPPPRLLAVVVALE